MTKHPVSVVEELSNQQKQRAGTVLVVFMLSLAMLSMTALAMVRVTLLQRDMVRSNELIVQSEWLFQSAVVRASSQLQASEDYDGEEWKIDAETIGQMFDALAQISVEQADEQTKGHRVVITVMYPPDDVRRVMVSRSVMIAP